MKVILALAVGFAAGYVTREWRHVVAEERHLEVVNREMDDPYIWRNVP